MTNANVFDQRQRFWPTHFFVLFCVKYRKKISFLFVVVLNK
jgi:hypothetical protein